MTRVVAGRFRGRRLAVPPSGTRPTSDMAREAVFSTLTSLLGELTGKRFLDLYAGSGAVGIEAWSRGAAVTLIESAPKAVAAIRANIAQLGEPADDVHVVHGKAETMAADLASSTFDVVFADPPYDLPSGRLGEVIAALRPALAAGGVVVVERSARDEWAWPEGVEAIRERRYGDAAVWYGRVTDAAEDS
ncbi:MAG TPA: 16S rRNA (guanine(966)-N(2))-methyltransferase RsmD [Acidothermaceae bacterium]|nr:16S rRNA (guanine(966)-N(2))-methyltransferase RsmD [Acidothermaceae bacterium]